MLICGRDVVQRVAEFEELAKPLHMRHWQWELLLALDGRTPLADLAPRLEMELSVVLETVAGFCEQGLLAVNTLKLEEYRRRLELMRARSRGYDAPSQNESSDDAEASHSKVESFAESGSESDPFLGSRSQRESFMGSGPQPESFVGSGPQPESFLGSGPQPESFLEPKEDSDSSAASAPLPTGIAFSLKAPPGNTPSSPPSAPGSIGFKIK